MLLHYICYFVLCTLLIVGNKDIIIYKCVETKVLICKCREGRGLVSSHPIILAHNSLSLKVCLFMKSTSIIFKTNESYFIFEIIFGAFFILLNLLLLFPL